MVFKNTVGLAAGFDKHAKYLHSLKHLGFGHVEVGTVTPLPQEGNPKPRLFRLPKDEALMNRMGFNNDGVEVVYKRLLKRPKNLIVGGNIGKNKITPNEDAVKDYELCFEKLFPVVDYFTVNVSSPNTPGLRELQEKDSLMKILGRLQELNMKKEDPKSIFLKIAPDVTDSQLHDIVDVVLHTKIQGIIATNTTVSREGLRTNATKVEEMGQGGISGKPLRKRSLEVIRYLKERSHGRYEIIGAGGVFTREDLVEKLEAGASLVQIYTGFIYEGPFIVRNLLK
jgi:dihydroorotate dehydrogenase